MSINDVYDAYANANNAQLLSSSSACASEKQIKPKGLDFIEREYARDDAGNYVVDNAVANSGKGGF